MQEEFLKAMAGAASDLVKRIHSTRDRKAKRGLLTLLLTLCRNMEDICPRNASKAAQTRADELNIGDLRQYHFDDGGKFPGGRKSSNLHWEHWKPAVDLRDEMLSVENPDQKEMERILVKARVCWILMSENDALNSLGHRTRRSDPQKCYDDAGIEMNYEW